MKPSLQWTLRIGAFAVAGAFIASAQAAAPAAKSTSKAPQKMPHTSVDHPEFVPASQANFLSDTDVLLGVAASNEAKAYPAADVSQHGAIHDRMKGVPIAVTWCSICNTGVVFRAEAKGRSIHFDSAGIEGLVGANEVFKDRETGSRWQQATAQAISGPLKGTQLDLYPFVRTTWGVWKKRYPNTLVLKPLPGYAELLPVVNQRIANVRFGEGAAPYGSLNQDNRLRPLETVAGLEVGGESQAYPFSELRKVRVANENVGATPILVVHQPASDTTTAFEARLNGRTVRFRPVDQEATELADLETNSKWNAYGLCLSGKLKGSQLKPLILVGEFWFAWAEFHPQTKVFTAGR